MLDFTNRQSYKWQAPDALVMQGWRSNHKRSSPAMAAPYFRSNYSEVKTQFEPPFDNCVCIPLTKGHHSLIDADDYEKVVGIFWRSNPCRDRYLYARNDAGLLMHRVVTEPNEDEVVDHINHNTLDNRKCNLRNVTPRENKINSKPNNNNPWLKGVKKQGEMYTACIVQNKKYHHIGQYRTAEDAATAYDQMAYKLFGEFAYLNSQDSIHKPTPSASTHKNKLKPIEKE